MNSFVSPATINSEHRVSDFDCGKLPLNDFLQNHALDKQNARLSRTYVLEQDGSVVAYYTLAHILVTQEESPKKFGRGMPSAIPTILLARLAVDRRSQNRGLGRSLLIDALKRTWAVMEVGAAPVRLFAVDAKDDEAAAFYVRFNMIRSPHNPMRLFLSYKTIASVVGDEK